MYGVVVGEIGIDRRTFLYEMELWEVQEVMKGYRRRSRDLWSAVRWMTFNVMGVMPYFDMRKAGLYKPTDLISFPWDKEPGEEMSEEDVDELRKMMREMRGENENGRDFVNP